MDNIIFKNIYIVKPDYTMKKSKIPLRLCNICGGCITGKSNIINSLGEELKICSDCKTKIDNKTCVLCGEHTDQHFKGYCADCYETYKLLDEKVRQQEEKERQKREEEERKIQKELYEDLSSIRLENFKFTLSDEVLQRLKSMKRY